MLEFLKKDRPHLINPAKRQLMSFIFASCTSRTAARDTNRISQAVMTARNTGLLRLIQFYPFILSIEHESDLDYCSHLHILWQTDQMQSHQPLIEKSRQCLDLQAVLAFRRRG